MLFQFTNTNKREAQGEGLSGGAQLWSVQVTFRHVYTSVADTGTENYARIK